MLRGSGLHGAKPRTRVVFDAIEETVPKCAHVMGQFVSGRQRRPEGYPLNGSANLGSLWGPLDDAVALVPRKREPYR